MKTEKLYLQHLTSKNDVNGNPRRLYILFSGSGNIQDIFDEEYNGKPIVVFKDRNIQMVYAKNIGNYPVIPYENDDRNKIQYIVKNISYVVVTLPGFAIPISEYNSILKTWR